MYQQNNQQITVAILKFLAEKGLETSAVTKFCSLSGILTVIYQSDYHQEIKYNYCPVARSTPAAGSYECRSSFKLSKMSSRVGLPRILQRVPHQVVDRGKPSRYRGYRVNKIPRADLKTEL
jgi:hypothetical protein